MSAQTLLVELLTEELPPKALARLVAQAYYESREALGFPMRKEKVSA